MVSLLVLAAVAVQGSVAAPQGDEGRGAVMSPERIRAKIHPGVIRPTGVSATAPGAGAPADAAAPAAAAEPGAAEPTRARQATGGEWDVRLVGIGILLLVAGVFLSRIVRKVRA